MSNKQEVKLTKAEAKDHEQNVLIGNMYLKFQATINDPIKCAIMTARAYANACIIAHKASEQGISFEEMKARIDKK